MTHCVCCMLCITCCDVRRIACVIGGMTYDHVMCFMKYVVVVVSCVVGCVVSEVGYVVCRAYCVAYRLVCCACHVDCDVLCVVWYPRLLTLRALYGMMHAVLCVMLMALALWCRMWCVGCVVR